MGLEVNNTLINKKYLELVERDIPEVQIIGPFATEYSLAKVNRELAIHLSTQTDEYKVSLWADNNFTDRLPTSGDYRKYPELERLSTTGKHKVDIAIINAFPKSFPHSFGLKSINADIKIAYLAWEETAFPSKIVDEFNTYLTGIMVPSEHVLNVFRKVGIKVPIVNVGEGINQNLLKAEKYNLKTKKKFKFLHISSGIPRKGVDILIKAYLNEFSDKDDVCLVIKTHHNEENQIPKLLKQLKRVNSPEIEVIYNLELTENQIAYLYETSDTVVIPSRAEGFGLPIAEAMLKKRPVITTGYSGQMDFVNSDNSWLLDYKLEPTKSQLGLANSYWAEPSVTQLQEYMRYLYSNSKSPEVSLKVGKAYNQIKSLTWERTTKDVLEFIKTCSRINPLKDKKLAVISTRNSRCGIAEYSKDFYSLIENSFRQVRYYANSDVELVFKDDLSIERTWEYSERNFERTITSIDKYDPDIVHIQYNTPFYSLSALSLLIDKLQLPERKLYLTIHSIPDIDLSKYKMTLEKVDIIFIHSEKDMNRLAQFDIKNIQKFTHGIKEYLDEDRVKLRRLLDITNTPILASHGMIHEKKGLIEIIYAIKELRSKYPDILFLSVNAVNSDNATSLKIFRQMQKLIDDLGLQNNILLIPDFLEKEEIIKLLHLADVILLPYDELGEGASGAVRYCLSSNRPVITTNSAIFSDLGEAVFRIEKNDPQTIALNTIKILENKDLYKKQLSYATKFIKKTSWETQSRKYLDLLS